MFGGEDDDDFTPNPSSKLASLFGFGKTSSEEGNASLTYTAPKQPKKSRTESQNSKASEVTPPSTSSSAPKLSIILVKAVSTYKLAEGNYNAQGKLGAAVLGNAQTKMYQLLLYKGKQQHVTSCRITAQFQFMVQPNNYATFYDDQTQNWSVMFETSKDAIDFAKEIGLARANSVKNESEKQLLTQDLLFGVGSGANEGDMVEIRYVVNPTNDGKQLDEIENTMQAEKPVRVKLSKGGWEEGILGASKGCKRMIMLPPGFESPWKGIVSTHCGVVVEVEVGRFKSMRPADSGDSTDDTSIKARGESISEALTNSPKTHKASIISRMARMGQATLPLKGAVPCNPSDSEETEEETSVVNKAPAKTRVPKNRPSVEKPVQNTMLPPPQHVALYQPVWQQGPPTQQTPPFMRANGSMTYMQPPYPMQTVSSPQMYPVNTPPAMPSPESHMSILLAEGRTQNAELRMGVAKIADKVDQVLMKLDTVHQLQQRREPSVSGLESTSLMGSLQKLAAENETLRVELDERRNKIDQLYEMLHSNMKEPRNDTQVLALQKENSQFTAELDEARSKIEALEESLNKKEDQLVNCRKLIRENELKSSSLEEDVNNFEVEAADMKKIIMEEKRKNHQLVTEHEKEVQPLKDRIEDCEAKIKHYQELLQKNEMEELKRIEQVKSLQQENSVLNDRIRNLQEQNVSAAPSIGVSEVKKVMNVLYNEIASHFSAEVSYNGVEIKKVLVSTIRDVTLTYLGVQRDSMERESSSQSGSTETKSSRQATSSQSGSTETKSSRQATSSQSGSTETKSSRQATSSALAAKEKSASDVKTENLVDDSSQDVEVKEVPASSKEKSTEVPIKEEAEQPEEMEVEIIDDHHKDKSSSNVTSKSKAETPPPKTIPSVSEAQKSSSGHDEPKQTEAHKVPEAQTKTVEKDGDKSSNASQAPKEKQSRDSSPERSWRPQPPPPPLFDDEDDDDDWLS